MKTSHTAPDILPEISHTTPELISEINLLRDKKRAVILAHYYQVPQIQDIADFVGDSLGLAQQAAATDADMIVFAGVVFMAETAKILNPSKKVVVPDLSAGCSLADNCPPDRFAEFLAGYPKHTVITYINSSVAVKAMTDIICTSSNAEKVINSVPLSQPIVFAPDKHLGAYLVKRTGRDMVLWDGSCEVHEMFDAQQIVRLKARHPEALVLAHPECTDAVLELADHIGSTSSLLAFVQKSAAKSFIVVTESGIIHQMLKACPEKSFYAAPLMKGGCTACAECPYMRLNTLQKLYLCLRDETPEIQVPEEIRARALVPIARMLEIS